jgi:hypothetical protein
MLAEHGDRHDETLWHGAHQQGPTAGMANPGDIMLKLRDDVSTPEDDHLQDILVPDIILQLKVNNNWVRIKRYNYLLQLTHTCAFVDKFDTLNKLTADKAPLLINRLRDDFGWLAG